MARSPDVPPTGAAADSERIGLVWMDAERALIAYWRDEPVVERIESGVPPKRTAVGSVRRGPARPASGSHRAAHRTEGRHVELMRRYLADLAERLADLDQVEVSGRGQPHARFAELLERLGAQAGGSLVVTTRSTARRPTEPQLIARLRKLADQELPRRTSGPYRDPLPDPEASRPARPAAARRNPRPRRLPERREIDLEVEMMLADEPQPTDEP